MKALTSTVLVLASLVWQVNAAPTAKNAAAPKVGKTPPPAADTSPKPGPFFEPEYPFFQTAAELGGNQEKSPANFNFVVRGIVLPVASGHCLIFDQELLRVAALWSVPAGQPLVSLNSMAQVSYADIHRKAGPAHPKPGGPLLLSVGMHPGAGFGLEALAVDPRPPGRVGDVGRGPLPATTARFDGVELAGSTAILQYHIGAVKVREWFEAHGSSGIILRHLEVAPHPQALTFSIGACGPDRWTVAGVREASSRAMRVATNSAELALSTDHDELVATLAKSAQPQRVTIAMLPGPVSPNTTALAASLAPTPAPPQAKGAPLRWNGEAVSAVRLETISRNGLILDRIAVPQANPWKRRVRPADLAFLSENRAAIVTYDGDVWMVDGLADPKLAKLVWKRFASGLHEPLAIAARDGIVQVATKNGVVRLYDRDANGEADWFENFSDLLLQSQTTRSFPLDMGVGSDGSTFVSQGGIVDKSKLASGGSGTAHTGGILKISPDGRSAQLVSQKAREPFLAVDPLTGTLTGTDQQGHYIPASVCYLIRPGDSFGFCEDKPAKLTPPLVWLPIEQDTSSSSELWLRGAGMGAWDGRLLHLSYGTGRLFLISPDLEAPIPQGAMIPLDFATDLPALHARMQPSGGAAFLAGFQIYGSLTATNWDLARLRPGTTPIATPLAARTYSDGVTLEFATPLDPASVTPANITAIAWNYKRSSDYGSGRYMLDGQPGVTPWPVGETFLSGDHKSVFIHLPKLPALNQLEIEHHFQLANKTAAAGRVYFTINQPRPLNLEKAGFVKVDLSKSVAVVRTKTPDPASTPTAELGEKLSVSKGCAACHSADGTTEGKPGPTWKGLFGSGRIFTDGGAQVANEFYIRDSILEPQKFIVRGYEAAMPSYNGNITEDEIKALILYIKALR